VDLQVRLRLAWCNRLPDSQSDTAHRHRELPVCSGGRQSSGLCPTEKTGSKARKYCMHRHDSSVMPIPAGKGRGWMANSSGFVNAVLGGWQLSGINSSQRPNVVLGQPLYPANQNPSLCLYHACQRHMGRRRANHFSRARILAGGSVSRKEIPHHATDRYRFSGRRVQHLEPGATRKTPGPRSANHQPIPHIRSRRRHSAPNAVPVAILVLNPITQRFFEEVL